MVTITIILCYPIDFTLYSAYNVSTFEFMERSLEMPKGHSRNRLKVFSIDFHFGCDEKTDAAARRNAKVRGFDSVSAYMRWLVSDDDKRLAEPESYGYAVSLKGSTPMSGTDQR